VGAIVVVLVVVGVVTTAAACPSIFAVQRLGKNVTAATNTNKLRGL
jgi:hypothetical protein